MSDQYVKFKRLNPVAKIPSRKHSTDVGFDLTATSMKLVVPRIQVDEGSVEFIPGYVQYGTGIAVELPEDFELQIRPRSSVRKYDLIMANSVGTIDPAYIGEEIFVTFKIHVDSLRIQNAYRRMLRESHDTLVFRASDFVKYSVGDRIAQAVLKRRYNIEWVEVESFSTDVKRGGHGSTGV